MENDKIAFAFSTCVWNFTRNIDTARELKEGFSNCLIVFAEPQVDFIESDFFENFSFVDIVVHKEEEETFSHGVSPKTYNPDYGFHYEDCVISQESEPVEMATVVIYTGHMTRKEVFLACALVSHGVKFYKLFGKNLLKNSPEESIEQIQKQLLDITLYLFENHCEIRALFANGVSDDGPMSTMREIFNFPEIVNSQPYEYRSETGFYSNTYLTISGERVRLGSPAPRKSLPIGKCIVIGKNVYDNGNIRYFHRGRSRSN